MSRTRLREALGPEAMAVLDTREEAEDGGLVLDHWECDICRYFGMGRVGIEPTTLGLRVPCSTS
jgi:hypothetical protein